MEQSPLLERKNELRKQLAKVESAINKEIADEHYPKIKKQYEGKCFKVKNSYGSGKSWWLYTRVVEIRKEDVYDTGGNRITSHFKGFNFQCTPSGEISIDTTYRGCVHSLGKYIPESEFNAAWNKIMGKMDAL